MVPRRKSVEGSSESERRSWRLLRQPPGNTQEAAGRRAQGTARSLEVDSRIFVAALNTTTVGLSWSRCSKHTLFRMGETKAALIPALALLRIGGSPPGSSGRIRAIWWFLRSRVRDTGAGVLACAASNLKTAHRDHEGTRKKAAKPRGAVSSRTEIRSSRRYYAVEMAQSVLPREFAVRVKT
jgi:hypothetical protein